MTTTTLQSGTQRMQLRTTFTQGQGWMTQRFDEWRGQWEQGSLSSQTWFRTEEECDRDLQQRMQDFLDMGWELLSQD